MWWYATRYYLVREYMLFEHVGVVEGYALPISLYVLVMLMMKSAAAPMVFFDSIAVMDEPIVLSSGLFDRRQVSMYSSQCS